MFMIITAMTLPCVVGPTWNQLAYTVHGMQKNKAITQVSCVTVHAVKTLHLALVKLYVLDKIKKIFFIFSSLKIR